VSLKFQGLSITVLITFIAKNEWERIGRRRGGGVINCSREKGNYSVCIPPTDTTPNLPASNSPSNGYATFYTKQPLS
jgi:hypothetical protein